MDLVSTSPIQVGSVVWQLRPSMWVMTVVCKATYKLTPVESPLTEWQEPLNDVDGHLNDDPLRSLRAPGDFAPFKIRAEVVLVGNAFAPGRAPVRSLTARMVVGSVDKSIEVTADRMFTQDGRLQEAPMFANMPLLYERAAGGPDTRNPVGVRATVRDTYGQLLLPNLQPPGMLVSTPTDYIEPVGFGPIAATWAERRDRLGRHAATFVPGQIADTLVPDDIDPLYFNVAPRDQQLDALRENERILLENLHPAYPRLVTSLSGQKPRAFLEGRKGGVQSLPLRADLLWIDTDRAICTLTWRAQISLKDRHERGRVVIALEQPGQTLTWPEVQRAAGPSSFVEDSGPAPELSSETVVRDTSVADPRAMPFAPSSSSHEDALAARREQRARTGMTMPFALSGVSRPPPPQPAVTPPPIVAPAPVVSAPPAYRTPPVDNSPWASGSGIVPSPVEGMMSQGLGRAVSTAPPSAPEHAWSPPSSPVDARAERIAHASQAALAGVVAASDAAAHTPSVTGAVPAATSSSPGQARSAPREYIELLWFDDKAPQRVRAQTRWASSLDDRRQDSEWITAEEAVEPLQEVKDRRDLNRAMTRVPPVDGDGVGQALAESIDEEGMLTRPLVVVTGELQLLFEELETLKATIAVVSPLLGADKKLSELVIAANETASSSWRCTSAVADGMTARLKEAFAQANRSLSLTYVDSNVERILLDQRRYQKRMILGSPRLRASLVPAAADGSAGGKGAGIPTYLPERLERELPMFQRFRATVIAEAQSSQDQFESHPSALVVLALGRVLSVRQRPG
ncbi:MAG: DUF2169 domain-containing protein [Byssovorax sp.]